MGVIGLEIEYMWFIEELGRKIWWRFEGVLLNLLLIKSVFL
jgi:hypothetical protein